MAITLTPQTANSMDHGTVRQLIALQVRCPASVRLNVEAQPDGYLISYSINRGDERYTARETCQEVIDACELIIEVIISMKEGL